MGLIYLTRHGMTVANAIIRVTSSPTFEDAFKKPLITELQGLEDPLGVDYARSQEIREMLAPLDDNQVRWKDLEAFLYGFGSTPDEFFGICYGVYDNKGTLWVGEPFLEEALIPYHDISLLGKVQGQIIGDRLKDKEVTFLTSSLIRTHQTAEAIAEQMGIVLVLGENHKAYSKFDEKTPLEAVVRNLRRMSLPEELGKVINRGLVWQTVDYLWSSLDEVRELVGRYREDVPFVEYLMDPYGEGTLHQRGLRQDQMMIGRSMSEGLVDYMKSFNHPEDVVAVFHGDVNAALLNYLDHKSGQKTLSNGYFDNGKLVTLEYTEGELIVKH